MKIGNSGMSGDYHPNSSVTMNNDAPYGAPPRRICD